MAANKEAALAALKANGGAIRKTARELSIPESTLRGWARQTGGAGAQEKTCADLASELRRVAHLLLGDLAAPEARSKANVRDLAIALGILLDKADALVPREGGQDDPLDGLLATMAAKRAARKAE